MIPTTKIRKSRWAQVLLTMGTLATIATAQPRTYPLGDGPWEYETFEQRTKIRVSVVARNLSHPWSIAFLPGTATSANPMGDALVNERDGRIRLLQGGALTPDPVGDISHLNVDYLFDLALHPDFEDNGWVYITYMKMGERPGGEDGYYATTALARGTWDGMRVNDIDDLFVADAWSVNRGSDASRIVFAPDGTLYWSSSHRRHPEDPQLLSSHIGKILRLNDDGSVPADNPYVHDPDARPEIFSRGHRTVLGLTVHPETGAIWETENGPQGGDEVNILRASVNYGWPVVTYGRDYDGTRPWAAPWRDDMEAPELFWVPSITASGLLFYTGDQFPAWQNNLFVGSMTTGRIAGTGHIERVVFNENGEMRREEMLNDLHQRIRDVRQGPDGNIYLLTDETEGAVLRIEPLPGE